MSQPDLQARGLIVMMGSGLWPQVSFNNTQYVSFEVPGLDWTDPGPALAAAALWWSAAGGERWGVSMVKGPAEVRAAANGW